MSFALRRGGGGSQLSYSYSQSSYSTATTLAPRTFVKIGENDPPAEPHALQAERWDLFSMVGMDGVALGLTRAEAGARVAERDEEEEEDFDDPFPALTYEAADAEGLGMVTLKP